MLTTQERGSPRAATGFPSPGAAWNGSIGGALASLAVLALCGAIMPRWSAGLAGDLLLGAVAAGLLLRLPPTVPLWAGLTLLVAIAVALLWHDSTFADLLGNLLFFAFATGCLWYLWDTLVDRFGWRLPVPAMLHQLAWRTASHPSLASRQPTAAS